MMIGQLGWSSDQTLEHLTAILTYAILPLFTCILVNIASCSLSTSLLLLAIFNY